MFDLYTIVQVLPRSVQLFLLLASLSITLLISTYIFTNSRYKLALYARSSPGSNQGKPLSPAKIPYAVPFLGSALSFLAPRPGEFWRRLFRSHPRDSGACTILLGGLSTHILFSPQAITALFKARDTTRQNFNNQVVTNSLGLTQDECATFYGLNQPLDENESSKAVHPMEQQEKINQETLLKTESVNELTSEFSKIYSQQLSEEDGFQETGLYEWLRPRMFKASTIAFMGQRVLEIYPELEPDFFLFDKHMLSLFFGIPKLFISDAHKVRNRVLDGLELFNKIADEESKGTPVNPQGEVKWEPIYGSRANRARQVFYREVSLAMRARAGLDLGFLFGLSSNTIPATCWMLMHILSSDDETLMPRVMKELDMVKRPDGTLDVPTLISLPLLQSIFQEVLRMYTDVLVTRLAHKDLVLPINDQNQQVLIKKGTVAMAPSWIAHHDEDTWLDPPCETFYAERFLKKDPETGKETFTLTSTNGKLFPFGGGKSICPGRVFAKQEVLGSLAMTLLTFDFELLGFLDEQGKDTTKFPSIRNAFLGTGVVVAGGDLKVRIRKRTSKQE